MSEYRESQDVARLDQMAEDEYAPAQIDTVDELEAYLRPRNYVGSTGGRSGFMEDFIGPASCQRKGCYGRLDEDYFCVSCGETSLPRKPRA